MKQKLAAMAAALLLALTVSTGAFADPLAEGEPLTGTVYYPEGADRENAAFSFSYAYPQFVGGTEAENAINQLYQYELNDMLLFTAPMYSDGETGEAPSSMTVSYQLTLNDDDYLCVLFTREQWMGAAASEMLEAHVFGRQGAEAGQVVNLPNVLGTLDFSETDERKVNRAARQASALIYDLVWEIICQQIEEGSDVYFDDLIREDLEAEFYPENDFYMDGEGNVVFYIQSGMISNQAAGVLYYPFSLAELLSEL